MSDEIIENFCRNAHTVMRLSTTSVADEREGASSDTAAAVREALEDDAYTDPAQVHDS